jgi:thioredoxin
MPLNVTESNYEKEVVKSEKPVIIEIFAPWCGVCQQMEPIIQELEQELARYKFVTINVEEARDLAGKFGVTSVPTFVFMKNGEVKGTYTGYIAKEDLIEKMKKLLD